MLWNAAPILRSHDSRPLDGAARDRLVFPPFGHALRDAATLTLKCHEVPINGNHWQWQRHGIWKANRGKWQICTPYGSCRRCEVKPTLQKYTNHLTLHTVNGNMETTRPSSIKCKNFHADYCSMSSCKIFESYLRILFITTPMYKSGYIIWIRYKGL